MIFSILRFGFFRLAVASLVAAVCARATTVVPPEFATLVNESDYVVHAVAKSVSSEKRTGPNGGAKIYTRVEFEVIEVVAGSAPATIALDFLGGRVGSEQMTVEGMPRFQVGDEDILFVSGNGRSICPLYAMMHGRYRVDSTVVSGRKIVTRADGSPLQSTVQIATAMSEAGGNAATRAVAASSALEPAEFIRQIRETVRPDAHVNRAK
jgi:hypothetical protein